MQELSRQEARRIAVRAQRLDADRPTTLLDLVHDLTLLQDNPAAAVAPSADLVSWSRLGPAYDSGELDRALDAGTLVVLEGMIRPGSDMALYRADMTDWPGRGHVLDWQDAQREWVAANDDCRQDILYRLEMDGPLRTRDLPDTCLVPWKSSGWNNGRNVTMLLGLMAQRGEVATVGRQGAVPRWDLATRIYPDGPTIPAGHAAQIRNERRLRALGIARAHGPDCPVEPLDVGEVGEPAVVEGVRGVWRVDPDQLGRPFTGRAALLSPLDRLVHDRRRMVELFDFDYQLEMYKPAAKRRWGYFALPILYGDRLVGKLDATADRKAGVLRVDAIHRDVTFTAAMTRAVDREVADLARWLDLDLALPD